MHRSPLRVISSRLASTPSSTTSSSSSSTFIASATSSATARLRFALSRSLNTSLLRQDGAASPFIYAALPSTSTHAPHTNIAAAAAASATFTSHHSSVRDTRRANSNGEGLDLMEPRPVMQWTSMEERIGL